MNAEHLLVSRLIQDADVACLYDRNISAEMFADPIAQQAVRFILEFHKKYKAVPSPTALADAVEIPLKYAPDPADHYLDDVAEQYVRNGITAALLETAKAMEAGTPTQLSETLRSRVAKLSLTGARNIQREIGENVDARFERYLARKNSGGMIGLPTPWTTLDKMTLGWQKETYNGIVGRPGLGKTHLVHRCAIAVWKAGGNVLFCNEELPDETMDRRHDSHALRLCYERFRAGMLTTHEEERYKDGLADMAARRGEFNGVGDFRWAHGASTVAGIAAKCEEHGPDFLVIDGAYLLRPDQSGLRDEAIQKNISRGIKRSLVTGLKLPVLISVQINRDGDEAKNKGRLSMSNIAGSDAFAQDCDIVVAIGKQTDDERAQGEVPLVPLKSRDAPLTPFLIAFDFETMDFRELGTRAQLIDKASKDADTEFDA